MENRGAGVVRPASRVQAQSNTKSTVVLGIDPGTAVTGYGVVSSDMRGHSTLLECGVIRTAAAQPLPKRLFDIHEGISEIIARHKPQRVAVESVFYARNVRTTIVLGHARGVILLAAEAAGLEIDEFPPAEIKKVIAGTGAATKAQIQFMVAKLLRLKTPPQPADAADGVAAALCSCMSPRALRPILVPDSK